MRTSKSHPLRIDWIDESPANGRIGMTFCPGKIQENSMTGGWHRDLNTDLLEMLTKGVTHVMCLLEEHELDELSVPNLAAVCRSMGLEFLQMPIRDTHPPVELWKAAWEKMKPSVLEVCKTGRLVIFCKGGLGRTGLYAAIVLQELGLSALESIALVRKVRAGTIETEQQLAYVMNYKKSVNYMGGGIGGDVDWEGV